MNFHQLPIEEVFDYFSTSALGLSQKEAERRLIKYSKNILPEEKKNLGFLFS